MARQIILAALCVFMVACSDDHINEYPVIKTPAVPESAPASADPGAVHAHESVAVTAADPAAGNGAPATGALTDPKAIQWQAPADWVSTGAGGMRLAGYQLPEAGDLSIISLGGDGGGMLANINRWRNQVGLAPIEGAQLAASTQVIESAVGSFTAVKLVNPASVDKAICGAVFSGADFTLFVKLTGSAACIEQNAEAVFAFCAQAKAR